MSKLRQLARMKQYGVLKATITYSGGGDDGAVEDCDIEWIRGKGKNKFLVKEVRSILETLAWEQVAESFEDGWYNNDGGQGEVRYDLSEDDPCVEVDHNQNITETENFSTTLRGEDLL